MEESGVDPNSLGGKEENDGAGGLKPMLTILETVADILVENLETIGSSPCLIDALALIFPPLPFPYHLFCGLKAHL